MHMYVNMRGEIVWIEMNLVWNIVFILPLRAVTRPSEESNFVSEMTDAHVLFDVKEKLYFVFAFTSLISTICKNAIPGGI